METDLKCLEDVKPVGEKKGETTVGSALTSPAGGK